MRFLDRLAKFFKNRNIPESIPIKREEDYHTHYIGKFNGNDQFIFYQTFVFSKPYHKISSDENWADFRREYAVKFLFNEDGDLIDHDFFYQGTASEFDETKQGNWIEENLESLGDYKFSDIRVKPFKVEIDGFDFGLIPNRVNQRVDMEPSSTMSFSYPWDGEYYT